MDVHTYPLRMCPIEACPHHFSADVEIPKSMLFDIMPLRSVAVSYVDFMVNFGSCISLIALDGLD